MFKFAMLTILVVCVTAAYGGVVVPATPIIAAAPAVALHSVPVATSYSNTYRAPVMKAAPVYVKQALLAPASLVHAAPIAHVKTTSVVHTAPIVHASPVLLKSSPLVAHTPIAVAHSPAVAVAPVATSYAATYKAPLIKSHVVAAPVAIIH